MDPVPAATSRISESGGTPSPSTSPSAIDRLDRDSGGTPSAHSCGRWAGTGPRRGGVARSHAEGTDQSGIVGRRAGSAGSDCHVSGHSHFVVVDDVALIVLGNDPAGEVVVPGDQIDRHGGGLAGSDDLTG